jgi:hypothetical protein
MFDGLGSLQLNSLINKKFLQGPGPHGMGDLLEVAPLSPGTYPGLQAIEKEPLAAGGKIKIASFLLMMLTNS